MMCFACSGKLIPVESDKIWEEFDCETCKEHTYLHVASGHTTGLFMGMRWVCWPGLSAFASTRDYWKWLQENFVSKWTAVAVLHILAGALTLIHHRSAIALALMGGYALGRLAHPEPAPTSYVHAALRRLHVKVVYMVAMFNATFSTVLGCVALCGYMRLELMIQVLTFTGCMFFLSDSYPRKPIRVWKAAPDSV